MHSLTINNSPTFQGAREIFVRDAIGNSERLSKPIQEALTQSELRAATYELMQDLNGMVLPKASLEETVGVRKMFAEEATKAYDAAVKDLSNTKIETIIK